MKEILNELFHDIVIVIIKYISVFLGTLFGVFSRVFHLSKKGVKMEKSKILFSFVIGLGLAGFAYNIADNLGYKTYAWAISYVCGLGGDNLVTYLLERLKNPESIISDLTGWQKPDKKKGGENDN